jgi:hypothetical protein
VHSPGGEFNAHSAQHKDFFSLAGILTAEKLEGKRQNVSNPA